MRRTKKVSIYRRPITLPKIQESRDAKIKQQIELLKRFIGTEMVSQNYESCCIPIWRDEDRRKGAPLDLRTAINVVGDMAYSIFIHPDKAPKALQPLARMQLESLNLLQDHVGRISKIKGSDYNWKKMGLNGQ